jgi:hypothetical protein
MDSASARAIANGELRRVCLAIAETHKPSKARLSGEHLSGIGLIVVKFARLEFTVGLYVTWVLQLSQKAGNVVTSEIPFDVALSILSSIDKLRGAPYPELIVLVRGAIDAQAIRNRILHSVWAGGSSAVVDATRIKTSAKLKKGLQYHFDDFSVGDLHTISEWIDNLDTAFGGLMLREMVDLSKASSPPPDPGLTPLAGDTAPA